MTDQEIKSCRKDVARFMRRIYRRGLTTASGGNISARIGNGIFITPSGHDKATIRSRDIGMLTFEGKNLTPALKSSMESGMHLEIYKVRQDVQAIVHAHPPVATSFTAMKQSIDCTLIAEARAVLGTPVIAPYALMGTNRLAEAAAAAASGRSSNLSGNPAPGPNVILLENHGIVCLGKDLLTAFDRLEVLEAAARMTLITLLLGSASPLNRERLEEIDKMLW